MHFVRIFQLSISVLLRNFVEFNFPIFKFPDFFYFLVIFTTRSRFFDFPILYGFLSNPRRSDFQEFKFRSQKPPGYLISTNGFNTELPDVS